MRNILLAGAAAGALMGLTPAPSLAQATPEEVIHACYVPGSGTVYRIRVEGGRDECTGKSHVYFKFNVTGPEGPVGPEGPTGPQGAVGPQGLAGLRGPAGPAGADGEDGADGNDGVNGKDGAPGADGRDGVDGMEGAPGPVGPQGSPGVSGYERIGAILDVPGNSLRDRFMNCPAGKRVFSGGHFTPQGGGNLLVLGASRPESDTQWFFRFHNSTSQTRRAELHIICAIVS